MVLVAIFAPLVVSLAGAPGPNTPDQGALDPVFATPTGPSSAHYFGVDQIGRDVFSRVIYGARISLIVAFTATFIATVFGVVAGLLAGYFRGVVDTLVSRTVDVLLAIPYLMLAIGLASACSIAIGGGGQGSTSNPGCLGGLIKPGLTVVIFVIAVTSWTYIARIIRGQVFSLREKEFVEAARSQGAGHTRIIFKEILPEPDRPDRRLCLDTRAAGDPLRGGAVVSRRRRAAAHCELGADDFRCHAHLHHRLVVHAFPRASHSSSRCSPSTSWATPCRTR